MEILLKLGSCRPELIWHFGTLNTLNNLDAKVGKFQENDHEFSEIGHINLIYFVHVDKP